MRAPGSEMKRLGHGIRSILTLHIIRPPEHGVRGVTRSHGARMGEEHVRAASSPRSDSEPGLGYAYRDYPQIGRVWSGGGTEPPVRMGRAGYGVRVGGS